MKPQWFRASVLALAFVLALPGGASAARDTGLGVIVGEPTGLSFKHWTGRAHAYDAAAAWSFVDEGALHVHADYLWHWFDRVEGVEGGRLPLYVGLGGRIKFGEDDELIGVRIPFGADFLFDDAPVDIFVEIVPILDLAPETDLQINAALGARFWFDRD